MNGLPGVESVRSVSLAGLSFVYMTFDWSTEIFRARKNSRDRRCAALGQVLGGVRID